jgi:hypothetical protein
VRERQVSILQGSAFVVSDRLGDVTSAIGNPNGLFIATCDTCPAGS